MSVLVTGAAGFIGFHVSKTLLARGDAVIGIDNLNPYYDVALKRARLAELTGAAAFTFHQADIADPAAIAPITAHHPEIDRVVHLAAQAGVRYSLENPYSYIESNVMGQVVMLEAVRRLRDLKSFVYASSSSVYGGNSKQPSSVDDRVDTPVSLYAATKRADELITHAYCHLYEIPATGLRSTARPPRATVCPAASTISAIIAPSSFSNSSLCSKRRSDARPTRSSCRWSPATWRRASPISKPRDAISAMSPRRRSASACRSSSRGTNPTTGLASRRRAASAGLGHRRCCRTAARRRARPRAYGAHHVCARRS